MDVDEGVPFAFEVPGVREGVFTGVVVLDWLRRTGLMGAVVLHGRSPTGLELLTVPARAAFSSAFLSIFALARRRASAMACFFDPG